MNAIRLRTEYLKDLLGLGERRPRLSWNCAGGNKQTAFQIAAEGENGYVLWDTGKVASASMSVRWAGKALESRAAVAWRVRLWGENDIPGDWARGCFELGLLEPEDWTARWITGDYDVDKKRRYPMDCFRRMFTIGKVRKARLYITACGLYRAWLNGEPVGNFCMARGIRTTESGCRPRPMM